MTLVFCHYINDELIIVTDSLITRHPTQKAKCAAIPNKSVVMAWWGDHDLEPKALTDDPLLVQPGDKDHATANFIGDKLPRPEDVWPCFSSAFLKSLNEAEHVHNGKGGPAGLFMGVAVQNSIHAFVYEATSGKGSWKLRRDRKEPEWPKCFGSTPSLGAMLQEHKSGEALSVLSEIKKSVEFTKLTRMWIEKTAAFQRLHGQPVTVALPSYKLVLRTNGTIEGPNVI
jgi:hypothetical protein